MPSVQPNEMDASIDRRKMKEAHTRDQTLQQVAQTRSYSRGWLTQAKRNGQHLTTDDNTLSRQWVDSEGFVDTPIGQGPATALHSPGQLSAPGAVGGLLPLPHQESMDLQHLIDVDEPNGVSMPDDDAASTSRLIHEESGQVDPPEDHHDRLAQEAGLGNLPPCPLEAVRLRRIETLQDESLVARLARL